MIFPNSLKLRKFHASPQLIQPIRILHILWHGEIGGAERAVYQLVREQLRDPDLEPAVAFAQPGGYYSEQIQNSRNSNH